MLRRICLPFRALNRWQRAVLIAAVGASFALTLWYGLFWPSEERFYDERFNARNIHVLLSGMPLDELNGFYPPLTWAPQALLLAGAGKAAALVGAPFTPAVDANLSPVETRLVRSTHALYGALTLLLVFLVAARLFDVETGLLATILLGLAPWHLHASSVFKPDAPLAFAAALVAVVLADLALAPSLRGWSVAAASVALCASCKLTGAGLALAFLPLLVAQWRLPGLFTRGLPAALAVGATCAAVFNPQLVLGREYFDVIVRFYGEKERVWQASRWASARELIVWLTDWTNFGLVVGTLGLLGLAAWLAHAAWQARRGAPLALARLGVALLPIGYTALYFAATAFFKSNNFVPVLQAVAIGAAFLLVAAVRALGRRWPRFVPLLVGAVLLGGAAMRGAAALPYVYRSVTPTTFDRLMELAAARGLLGSNTVVISEWLDPGTLRYEREQFVPGEVSGLEVVERLADLAPERRARLDAEVARATSALPAATDGSTVLRVDPRWLRVRGPALIGRFHPWPEPQRIASYGTNQYSREPLVRSNVPLPVAVEARELVQVAIWLRRRAGEAPSPPLVWLDGEALAALHGKPASTGDLFLTERAVVGRANPLLEFGPPIDRAPKHWSIEVYRWPQVAPVVR